MINLQNPSVPQPTLAIEIDRAVNEIQTVFDTNLDWLTHDYARAYRHLDKSDKRLYFPEVYIGNNNYHRATPDNDKKGMCFFIVGKEEDYDFEAFHKNFIKWNVGIAFSVNLKKINSGLLSTELFTQNIIRDVRDLLTMKLGGLSFSLKIKEVVREFDEVYRGFRLEEKNDYVMSPYQIFRFNCEVNIQEGCEPFMYDRGLALKQNISPNEITSILLPCIDFSIDDNFNSLSVQQKADLLIKLNP